MTLENKESIRLFNIYSDALKDLDKRITFFKKIFTLTFKLCYHKMRNRRGKLLFSNTEIIIIADFCLLLQIERVIDSSNKKLCH